MAAFQVEAFFCVPSWGQQVKEAERIMNVYNITQITISQRPAPPPLFSLIKFQVNSLVSFLVCNLHVHTVYTGNVHVLTLVAGIFVPTWTNNIHCMCTVWNKYHLQIQLCYNFHSKWEYWNLVYKFLYSVLLVCRCPNVSHCASVAEHVSLQPLHV